MVRYTLLRLLIFFGVLLALSLVGLRDNIVLLLGLSAVISAVLSYVLLRGMRDEMTAKLMDWDQSRRAAKAESGTGAVAGSDEAAEDAEVDGPDVAR